MAEERIDITGYVCPMTWVKTKLKLETLAPGDVLVVRLNRGEPLAEVPRSARDAGHLVEAFDAGGEGPPVELRIFKVGSGAV